MTNLPERCVKCLGVMILITKTYFMAGHQVPPPAAVVPLPMQIHLNDFDLAKSSQLPALSPLRAHFQGYINNQNYGNNKQMPVVVMAPNCSLRC